MMDRAENFNLLAKSEQSQSAARFVLVTIIAVYIGGVAMFTEQPPEIVRIAIALTIFSPIAGAWLYYVRRFPLPVAEAAWRLQAGIFADTSMIALTLAIGGINVLPLYVMYIWVIMGNGLRFGAHQMSSATAISVISLTIAALVSPLWILSPLATALLAAGLVIVDVFYRRVLNELTEERRTKERLIRELREAQLDVSEAGLLGTESFLENVQERMEGLPDGSFLAGIVVTYSGEAAAAVGNPHSDSGRRLAALVTSELRGADIATLGGEHEFWLLIEPKKIADAKAVANRVRKAFESATPPLNTAAGIAAYPMTLTDARGLFDAARASGARDDASKLRHLFAVDSD